MILLLVRTGGLGDCLLTLPVASRIKQTAPDAELHVLGNGTMLDAARLSGGFDGFHSLDDAGFAALFSGKEPSSFLRTFFSRFDAVYFFTAADRRMISRTVSAAGARVCHVLNPNPPAAWNRHIVDYLLKIIESVDTESGFSQNDGYKLFGSGHSVKTGLVIHPGSGGVKKNWPLKRFLSVAESWDGEITFILGPAEIERGIGNAIPGGVRVVCPQSLDVLCEQLSASRVYLGNDSGVSHCAAFCGTRSVVLFGPTNPAIWRPLGEHVVVLSSDDGSMEGIGTDRVLGALRELAGYL